MRKFLKSFLETFQTVAISVAIVLIVRAFVAQPFLVSGSSMEPTFTDGDYLLIDELSYRFREPERGEVIVFRYPGDHRSFYIKRVIGLPGERVVIASSTVTVYGADGTKALHEPYIANGSYAGAFDGTLADGQYFMMGDNRNFSYDSRSWGPLAKDDISGLVRFRLWPIETAKAFSAPSY